jgi:hypothetical protein
MILIMSAPSASIMSAPIASACDVTAAASAGVCVERRPCRGEQSAAENYKRDDLLHVALLCSGAVAVPARDGVLRLNGLHHGGCACYER